MALSSDERELVDTVEDKQSDFYAGILALVLYRYNQAQKGMFPLPTEEIQKLVINAYEDLNSRHEEDDEPSTFENPF